MPIDHGKLLSLGSTIGANSGPVSTTEAILWGIDLKVAWSCGRGRHASPGSRRRLTRRPGYWPTRSPCSMPARKRRAGTTPAFGNQRGTRRRGSSSSTSTPNSPAPRLPPSRPAESVARRGRALAVDLLAATQRPTQKAMGGGALRSQMSFASAEQAAVDSDEFGH
jgi:hypothetical protein